MAAIDFGTGANTATGDTVAQAFAKLQARIDAFVIPAPTPTLTLAGALTYTAGAASGSVVATISNVPAGSTPTISPNDGRLAIAGSASSGWKVVVGLSASSAGTIALTVAASGAYNATASVVVTAASQAPTGPVLIAFAGSSSPAYYLTQGTIPSPDSRVTVSDDGTTFATLTNGRHAGELGRQVADATGRAVRFIKGGAAGTTLAQWAAASSTYRAGLVAKINAATAAGSVMAGVLVQVGNNDLDAGGNSYAERLGLWRQLIAYLRSETNLPNLMIFIGGCQSKPNAKPIRMAWQREAEMTVVNTDAYVRFAFSTYDLPTMDGTHQTDASQVISGARHAAQWIAYLKGTTQSRAPRPSGIQRISDTVVRMLVTYPAGVSDFSPTTGMTGGYLVRDGAGPGDEIAGVGARISASAIDWTFPSTPGATNFIYSPNDQVNDVSPKGNDALNLPMEPDAGQFAVPAASSTPTVALSQAQSKPEGNSGATVYTFTVTRSNTSGAINVPWSFSALTTDASDYTGGVLPTGGTVAIADGAASGTFTVSVNGDTTAEPDETFGVSISAPSGYGLGSPSSITNTIANDDASSTPTVSLSGAQSKAEGNSGANLYTFTVTRSSSSGAVNVPWTFAAGTTDASDYTGGTLPTGGTVALADGITTATFAVSVNGDTTVESDESFSVSITAPSGYVLGSSSTATGTITNDDASGATYTATGKSAKQHYASGASNPPGEQPAGFNSFIYGSAATAKPLATPAGAATGWSTQTTTVASGLSSNTIGGTTGNDSGIYPDAAMLGEWYHNNTQVESYTGLDPTKYYDVYFFGSRGNTTGTDRQVVVTVTGLAATASQTLITNSNTTTRLTFAKVKPDASGKIDVKWVANAGGSNVYMGVQELVEFTGP